jgi:hypothetical protein
MRTRCSYGLPKQVKQKEAVSEKLAHYIQQWRGVEKHDRSIPHACVQD